MMQQQWLLSTAAALAIAAGTVGAAMAQDPPTANQGPQFGAEWGPGRQAPAPQIDAAPEPGALGAPSPGGVGAPAPQAPAPAPDRFGGCNYNLAGSWRLEGWETQPTAFNYSASLQVQQYGQWLQAQQQQGGSTLQYYGRCNGNSIQLDVYSGGQFIGYQYGNVDWGGRIGAMRAQFNWNTWTPNYSSGNESWQRVFF